MKLGAAEYTLPAESKKAADVEMMLLTTAVYGVIWLYAAGYLSWLVFYLLFHLCYMRFFMGNHDRMHANRSRSWPKPIALFAEYFALVVVPWGEPYDSIREKHFTHHASHLPQITPNSNMLEDPQSIYEMGGFWRSLFYCLFFEEAQLVIDIRNRHFTRSRWIQFAIYFPLQVLFLMAFGWEIYLGVFLAARLMSALAYLSFSWLPHTLMYSFGFVKNIPRPLLFIVGLLNGKRVKDGLFRHSAHHAWPQIPSSKLYILDEAVLLHPEVMPEMIATLKSGLIQTA